jgi:hypothetical protein
MRCVLQGDTFAGNPGHPSMNGTVLCAYVISTCPSRPSPSVTCRKGRFIACGTPSEGQYGRAGLIRYSNKATSGKEGGGTQLMVCVNDLSARAVMPQSPIKW